MENMNKGFNTINDSSGNNSNNRAQTNCIHNNKNTIEHANVVHCIKREPLAGDTIHISKAPPPPSPPPPTSVTKINDNNLTIAATSTSASASSSLPPTSPTLYLNPIMLNYHCLLRPLPHHHHYQPNYQHLI
ncbi:unnamed protein product [Absidia cylindrospora]